MNGDTSAKSARPGRQSPSAGLMTRRVLVAAAALAIASVPAPVRSQERFPTKNIRIIVPFPAGATTDMLARLFAQRMSDGLNQTVVVENVGGAGGSLGADQVAKATPDGYTLLFHNITFTTTTSSLQFVGRSRHDIEQDFVPIAVGAYVPLLLLAHPSVPARDLKDFVEYAKQTKDPLFYGSTGPGSIMNLMGEVLKRDTGIKMDHVPFRGAAPLVQEMLSGRIQFGGDQLSSSLQHVKSGALKALAVTTRSVALPEVPSVRELGFPNLDLRGWNGFFAPKGTPREIVTLLNTHLNAILKEPEVVEKLATYGAEPAGGTPDVLQKTNADEYAQMAKLMKELGISASN